MDDVSKSFMLKAQACMAANDFDDALNHLDHVVRRTKSGHRPPIDALDRRAVAFINLRRFAEAFQDSKRMIKEYRTDPRGYLRTVQVLKYQAQEKKDDTYVESALKVAMSGMKNANKSNVVLHKQLARVLERLKNPAEVVRHDPAKKLPNEIFIEILKNLKTSELLASRRVAKSWNGIVTGETRFWRKLDLRNVRTKFNTRGIQTLLHLATDANRQCQVTELNIAWTTRPKDADTVVRNILKKCTRLNTLRLPWWYSSTEKNPGWTGIKLPELENLTLEGLTVRGSLEWIGTTLSAFPTITRLTILDLPKDRRPQAYDPDQDDSFAGVSWPDSLPSLKHLDLFGLLHGPPTPFSAGWLHFDRLALSAPNLEHLNLNGTINFGAHETEMALLAPFENLTQVTIGGIAHGKFALSTASPLQVLSLEMMCDSSEFLDLRHDEKTARFSRLKKLAITDQLNTPDQWASFLDVCNHRYVILWFAYTDEGAVLGMQIGGANHIRNLSGRARA